MSAPNEMTSSAPSERTKKERVIKEAKDWIGTLLVVSTLIAGATFQAAFAVPAGLKTDVCSAALKIFLISNTLALCLSMSALILGFHAGRTYFRYRYRPPHDGEEEHARSRFPKLSSMVRNRLTMATHVLPLALAGVMVSYSSGLYALVPRGCSLVATFCWIAACGVALVGSAWHVALLSEEESIIHKSEPSPSEPPQ